MILMQSLLHCICIFFCLTKMHQFSLPCFKNSLFIVSTSLKFSKRCFQTLLSSNCDVATNVKGLLLDITGVLYESGMKHAINGSVEAIEKLRYHKIPFRFVTNESTSTRDALARKLQSFGFKISEEEIFCPGIAASLYIQENKLRPYLLVHPDILPEFSDCDQSSPNCVIVGDAGDDFTYKNMNKAFTILMKAESPILISLGKGKYYKEKDELVMDLGGFTAALEYATGVTAKVIGKPSSDYFGTAAKMLELKSEDIAMIGDDISSDVCASKLCGFRGVLVRTGKFREKDLEASSIKPDAVVDNLAQYVDMLCSKM